MKKYFLQSIFTLAVIFATIGTSVSQIAIVSGIRKGSYHEFAKDIVTVSDSIRIKLRNSYGSVDNLNQLMANTKPFVTFLQYDVLVNQRIKDTEEGTNKSKSIKILTPLADEEIHLITRKSSYIKKLKDLRDKKVAIGSRKQGTQVTARLIKKLCDIQWIEIELGFEEALDELLKGDIDAVFFVGYAPADKLKKYDEDINLKLVPIKCSKLKNVYSKATVPALTYQWQKTDIRTFAVKSVLATNISDEDPADKEKVIKLLSSIKTHYPTLQKEGHRKWKSVHFDYDSVNWEIWDGAKEILQDVNQGKTK